MINMLIDEEKIEKGLCQLITKSLVKTVNKMFPDNNNELETQINNIDLVVKKDQTKIHFEGDINMSSSLFRKLVFKLILNKFIKD